VLFRCFPGTSIGVVTFWSPDEDSPDSGRESAPSAAGECRNGWACSFVVDGILEVLNGEGSGPRKNGDPRKLLWPPSTLGVRGVRGVPCARLTAF